MDKSNHNNTSGADIIIDSDDDVSLKNNNNNYGANVEVGYNEEEEEEEDRFFIPVSSANNSTMLRKCIIYQPDLICKDESASIREQSDHVLYYYSHRSMSTTQHYITGNQVAEEAIQFSGLCHAISNFTTLVSTIENSEATTTYDNNNHTNHGGNNTTATTDPAEVYLSDKSILVYARLLPVPNEKNYHYSDIMAVLQIQQESQEGIIDCKSLRFILQKSMELFLMLHNVSPAKNNTIQQSKGIFTKYYNNVIDDINNNFFSSNSITQHLNTPILSSSFHFLHSILQLTPPSTTQSFMEHFDDNRPKNGKTWFPLKLKLQRCIHGLFQHIFIDDDNNNGSNNKNKTSPNEFKIMGASFFVNHHLLESFFVPHCPSSRFKEDDDCTIIADEHTLLLLYKYLLTTLNNKLNNDNTKGIHKTATSSESSAATNNRNKQHQHGERDKTTSTTKGCIINGANYCTSSDDSPKINGRYQYYHQKSATKEHGKFDLFTSTYHHDLSNTHFIWAPKIYNTLFTRIVFFHNDEFHWNVMLYLKDSYDVDCHRYDGDYIANSCFFEKLTTIINATIADDLVVETLLRTNAPVGNANSGSSLHGRIDDGTYTVVAIDRCMKRSAILLPSEFPLGNSICNSNNDTSERQKIAFKAATTSFSPVDIKNLLSGKGHQEFSLVKPGDELRCLLAASLPQEIMVALDDIMNEIQLGITTCDDGSAHYFSLHDESTVELLNRSGGGVCELCTLITLSQSSYKGSRGGECGNVWLCGRKLGSRELYVALDAKKYKTVRQVQNALSRIRTDLVHLPYS
jgi:hypothetical protein